ncbi:MAG: hypothetical protein U9N59_11410, partial [Campylobacterota bacterium]|nr:hypothetical protein [Campylobacterota bacterium]
DINELTVVVKHTDSTKTNTIKLEEEKICELLNIQLKSPTTNTSEKQKDLERVTKEVKKELSLEEEVKIYEEIKREIDIEMYFAINKVEDEATKDYYYKKESEFIDYCIEKNKNYKDYFESFMRYLEIGKQNNWNF